MEIFRIVALHDESDNLKNYKGFYVQGPGSIAKTFKSTPELDFAKAFMFACSESLAFPQATIRYGSSVDHIVVDVPGYWWSDPYMGVEFILSDAFPDAEKLVNYVKENKNG